MVTMSSAQLASAIAEHWGWGLRDIQIRPLVGGMTSAVWAVDQATASGDVEGHWVAKAVPAAAAEQFAAGLAIAAQLDRAGIPSGAPLLTSSGQATAPCGEGVVALLRRVDGVELEGETEADLRLIGRTLADVHRALLGGQASADVEDVEDVKDVKDVKDAWPPLDPSADHLSVQSWVRPVVVAGIAGYQRLRPRSLTWGLIHGDPAPEAFVADPATGACGLIDWGAGQCAPLLYDLASAVMYAGGPARGRPLVEAYSTATASPMPAAEISRGLLPMLDLRWSLQAYYFAHRIATHDMTGIDGPADNDRGLSNARAWWSARAAHLGVDFGDPVGGA